MEKKIIDIILGYHYLLMLLTQILKLKDYH
ncbi:hypothetical protein XBFM1_1540013 [Xenorhabdus bovienii str. feltiae Moldova]|uniref:Uncharacterized protein n=1 Tax=Xenorhabdus bovienii str. feltiae Moldova TaxID=1398200 RepID=A0A077NP87_XENBV|nr:hypothetical protein XBFM1_1540013 [Xenorhabdus bovienii str. feltiae Moldova]